VVEGRRGGGRARRARRSSKSGQNVACVAAKCVAYLMEQRVSHSTHGISLDSDMPRIFNLENSFNP